MIKKLNSGTKRVYCQFKRVLQRLSRASVVTRLPQLESWQFSGGLPCKVPLRTHSNRAMLLPPTQQSSKPMNYPYSQMPRLTNENKT